MTTHIARRVAVAAALAISALTIGAPGPAAAAPAPARAPALSTVTDAVPDDLLISGQHAVNLPSSVADSIYIVSCQPTATRPAWFVGDLYIDGDRAAGQVPDVDTSALGWPVDVLTVVDGHVTGQSKCVADVNDLPEAAWGAFGQPGDGKHLPAPNSLGLPILPGASETSKPSKPVARPSATPSASTSALPCNPSGALGACLQVAGIGGVPEGTSEPTSPPRTSAASDETRDRTPAMSEDASGTGEASGLSLFDASAVTVFGSLLAFLTLGGVIGWAKRRLAAEQTNAGKAKAGLGLGLGVCFTLASTAAVSGVAAYAVVPAAWAAVLYATALLIAESRGYDLTLRSIARHSSSRSKWLFVPAAVIGWLAGAVIEGTVTGARGPSWHSPFAAGWALMGALATGVVPALLTSRLNAERGYRQRQTFARALGRDGFAKRIVLGQPAHAGDLESDQIFVEVHEDGSWTVLHPPADVQTAVQDGQFGHRLAVHDWMQGRVDDSCVEVVVADDQAAASGDVLERSAGLVDEISDYSEGETVHRDDRSDDWTEALS